MHTLNTELRKQNTWALLGGGVMPNRYDIRNMAVLKIKERRVVASWEVFIILF